MPDRRQGDRRADSQKKLSITLTNFIMLCVVFVIIIISIILCSVFYKKGYTNGSNYGYSEGYNDGYSEGYNESYYGFDAESSSIDNIDAEPVEDSDI